MAIINKVCFCLIFHVCGQMTSPVVCLLLHMLSDCVHREGPGVNRRFTQMLMMAADESQPD